MDDQLDRRIEATRYCRNCGREVPVILQLRPEVVHVECQTCWGSFDLPRFAPNG